jgi:hypothetical protein
MMIRNEYYGLRRIYLENNDINTNIRLVLDHFKNNLYIGNKTVYLTNFVKENPEIKKQLFQEINDYFFYWSLTDLDKQIYEKIRLNFVEYFI